jgi:hypothetical protein
MGMIIALEMLAVFILGLGYILEIQQRHKKEDEIKLLNIIIQAKNDEIDYLKKNANTK